MTRSLLFLLLTLMAWTTAGGAQVPSNAHSRSAVERIRPQLRAAVRAQGLHYGAPIYVRIFKEPKELELWIEDGDRFTLFRVYDICTFSGRLGPKLQVGDLQSPEGFYFVTPGRMNPGSRFHLSFNLGYPNAYDRYYGRTGSALMVHGNCVSIGCYAMTDPGIEEIYALAEAALGGGQSFFRVHVFPFRMTQQSMERHQDSEWFEFWQNLKEGHDFFDEVGRPPNVEVADGRYSFEGWEP